MQLECETCIRDELRGRVVDGSRGGDRAQVAEGAASVIETVSCRKVFFLSFPFLGGGALFDFLYLHYDWF